MGLFSVVRAAFVASILSPLAALAGVSAEPSSTVCEIPQMERSFNALEDISSPSNSLLGSWLAWTIQLTTEQFKAQLLKAPFPVRSVQMLSLRRWGDQGAIVESDEFDLVMFKGTQDKLDAILDADFVTVDGTRLGLPGRVTHGFSVGFGALWPQVTEALLKIRSGNKPIWLVGHSLGGVYSQYTAYRLLNDGFDVKAVYGFAAPVPGNADFAAAYNAMLGDVTFVSSFGLDITPHVPPLTSNGSDFLASLPRVLRGVAGEILRHQRYASVGRYFLQGDTRGDLVEVADRLDAESQYWRKVSASPIPLPFLFLKNRRLIQDHLIDNYLCSLR
jgi:hypothetical protein